MSGVSTSFLYDVLNVVQELTGASPTANLLTGLAIDETFSRVDAAGSRSFIADGLGSTLALLDSAAAIQTQYTYEPFGKTVATGTSSSNPFQYTGRENDNTGLFFYRTRYYQPALQRFVSEDPIGPVQADTNLYGYVSNEPIDSVDPFGLAKCIYVVETHTFFCSSDDGRSIFHTDKVRSGASCCRNDPSKSNRSFEGPIPAGDYGLGKIGDTKITHLTPRVPIHPIPLPWGGFATRRTDLQIHPGWEKDSQGCITIDPGTYEDFRRFYQRDNGGSLIVIDGPFR